MKIGLLSDTHGFLDPRIFDYFRECDEVWHGGDIGDMQVARSLEGFKPLRAVFGNIDDKDIQLRFPEDLWFEREGLIVLITHIAGAPPRYNPRIKKILKTRVPDILVCGHSHILRVTKDPAYGNMLYLNPGAAGNQGFHHLRTLLRFQIASGEVKNMEAIDLGRRGALA
jgi:uncharacterized protein